MRILACEAVGRSGSVCWDDGHGEPQLDDLGGASAEVALVAGLDATLRARGRPDALAVAVGPGSFTGLRVAVMAVRTLAWIEALPVLAVDALTALACAQGSGCWWCLLPLKRDTTFQAVVQVAEDGRPQVLVPSVATLDAEIPEVPEGLDPIAIGPALAVKPDLVSRWRPGARRGSPQGVDARGVARAARFVEAQAWQAILPVYLQEAAPVLQQRQLAAQRQPQPGS